MFSPCDTHLSIELSEYDMGKILDLYRMGESGQPLEFLSGRDFNNEELFIAIEQLLENKYSIEFIGYRNNQETPSQALFRSVKTEKGTWLYKIWEGNFKICKGNIDKLLWEILYF